MLMAFFSWWYGRGWQQVTKSFNPRINAVIEDFSVKQLFRTLFAPWKRITTDPGRSIEARFRAAADNAFSRMVGLVVRIAVLFTALCVVIIVGLLSILEIIFWPLLPLSIPGFIIAGLLL